MRARGGKQRSQGRNTVDVLRQAACAGALLAAMGGLGGCEALPTLPPSPQQQQGPAHELVAGAAASVCADALGWLQAEPVREIRLDQPGKPGTAAARGGTGDVELVLRDVRDLPLPHLTSGRVTPLAEDGHAFIEDPRSRLPDLAAVVETTVLAADHAYDVDERDRSGPSDPNPAEVAAAARDFPGYVLRKLYIDVFAGLKGFVLDSRDGSHRIYATAGTQVFASRDYRDWATGLMMARPQFVSDAGLLMVRDAADYAGDPQHGGEVFFTGQSQGAVISQAQGFLTEELLNERPGPHHLVHVVAWGVAGTSESIVAMIERSQQGYGRDVWPPLERHWALTDANHRAVMQVWEVLAARWSRLDGADVAFHVHAVGRQLHAVGYFFDIDPFARLGTFLGTPLFFPAELVLPQRCEPLVTELVFDTRFGDVGLQLESHFLKGYRRAVQRGAIDLARPARVEENAWIRDVLPTVEPLGHTWLQNIYLARLGESEANWQRCLASGHWLTNANRDCRKSYWPGCAPETAGALPDKSRTAAQWCLLAGDDGQSEPGGDGAVVSAKRKGPAGNRDADAAPTLPPAL